MTSRDRNIVLVLGFVAVLAGFWFFGLKPKREEAKTLDAQVAAQQTQLQAAQATVAAGLKAKSETKADQTTVAQLGQAVPADDDLPSLLYQLDAVSGAAHVDFRGMARGSSTGAAAQAAAAAAGTSAVGSASLPPGAVVGTAGLATLPFTLDFSGSFFGLERFLGDVQDLVQPRDSAIAVRGRLLAVDGLSLAPADKGMTKIKARISATAYLAPDDKASASAATSASGPTAPSVAANSGSASTSTPSNTTNQIR
jgi:Tfp pilus assembly protein PilO